MKRKESFLLTIGIIVVIAILLSNYNTKKPFEKSLFALDTTVNITVYDKLKDDSILDEAEKFIKEKENLLSNFIDDSETAILNFDKKITPSPDLKNVVTTGRKISEKSKGAYDITINPLTKLWDFKKEEVPTKEEILKAQKYIDYNNVEIKENEIILKNNASLDLSSVTKGYIADLTIDFLKSKGVKNALCDFGGDIKVMGSPAKKSDEGFLIGIQDPKREQGIPLGQITLKDKSIVTSGIYERNFEKDGKIYHHIIDPKTGYPTDNDILSVSVISKNSALCDALATAVTVLGADEGEKLIKSFEDTDAIIVKKDNTIKVIGNPLGFIITEKSYKKGM